MSAPWEGGGRRQGQGIIPPHPLTRRSIAPNKGSASGSVPRTFLASASGPSMCFGRLGGRIPPWGGRGQGIYLCGCESVLGSAFCRGRKDTPEKKLPRFLGGPPLYSLILDVGTRMHLHIKFISFCFCFNLTRLRYLMRAPCFPGHTRGDWGSCEFLYGRSVTFHTRFCWTAPSVCMHPLRKKQALTHP